MPRHRVSPLVLIVCATLAGSAARAQELSLLAGATDADDGNGSYGWQFRFRKSYSPWFSASVGWLNEGHLVGHHRDGVLPQAWFGHSWGNRWETHVGAGPYFFFDTTSPKGSDEYHDTHGRGDIISLSASYRLATPWKVTLIVNEIRTPGNVSTRTALLGASYQMAEVSGAAERQQRETGAWRQQIGVFGGKVILNRPDSPDFGTYGIDYRLQLLSHLVWSFTWYHDEGTFGRPDRLATQAWLQDQLFDPRMAVGVGLGVYQAVGPPPADGTASPSMRGLLSLRLEWHLTSRMNLALSGSRAFSEDDRDRDVLALGVALRF